MALARRAASGDTAEAVGSLGLSMGLRPSPAGATGESPPLAGGARKPRVWNPITDDERRIVREYYETTPAHTFDLAALAASIGRNKPVTCRLAASMGLTSQSRQRSESHRAATQRASQGRWNRLPHPRGALGIKHGAETLAAISAASKASWRRMKETGTGQMSPEALQRKSDLRAGPRPPEKSYSRAAAGRRHDLGDLYVRSAWEANYARYLNLLVKMGVVEWWKYEPQTYWFHEIKRGVRTYTPDFEVKYKGDERVETVELKGWMDQKSRTRLARMAKYYPEVRITLIGDKEYRALKKKWASAIPHWETKTPRAVTGCRVEITPIGGAA